MQPTIGEKGRYSRTTGTEQEGQVQKAGGQRKSWDFFFYSQHMTGRLVKWLVLRLSSFVRARKWEMGASDITARCLSVKGKQMWHVSCDATALWQLPSSDRRTPSVWEGPAQLCGDRLQKHTVSKTPLISGQWIQTRLQDAITWHVNTFPGTLLLTFPCFFSPRYCLPQCCISIQNKKAGKVKGGVFSVPGQQVRLHKGRKNTSGQTHTHTHVHPSIHTSEPLTFNTHFCPGVTDRM